MAEELRGPYNKNYCKKRPVMNNRDHDYRRFLYLVECGTLHLPTSAQCYRPPIQERGDNFEAETIAMGIETKPGLVKPAQEMVVSLKDVFRLPEREVNIEVQPLLTPNFHAELSVEESSSAVVFGSLLVSGRIHR